MNLAKSTAINLCFFIFIGGLLGQNSPLDSIGFFELKATDQVHIDALGNLYILGENGLTSTNVYNQLHFEYTDRLLGGFDQIDGRNPFKIWLFNAPFGQMTILDKTLAPLSQYNMTSSDFDDVTHFCSSRTNNVWFFDANAAQLIRANIRFEEQSRSVALDDFFNRDIEVLDMLEVRSQLCVLVKNLGLLIFDSQGNFIKKYSLPSNVENIDYFIGQIYYTEKETFKYINLHSGERGGINDFKPEIGFTYSFNGNFMLKRGEMGVVVYALYL